MAYLRATVKNNRPMLLKTLSYYCIHVVVAAAVAFAVTGNLLASITLSLLEPTVQAVAYFFHEKAWARAALRRHVAAAAAESQGVQPAPVLS